MGKMELNQTMNLLQNIYQGKTDIRFKILQLYASYQSPYQWVICPETGDFVLSFATREKNAFNNKIHYYNLYDLIDE